MTPLSSMNGKAPAPSPTLARALIRSLTRGTAIAQGVRYIHVGHATWLAAQHELLAEIAEDGHSETKFVRGAYGAGKSHFLSVVQDRARADGWWTAHVECKVDKVQIDRFETLYPQIVGKLLSSDLLEAAGRSGESEQLDPARFLLDRWSKRQCKKAGIREDGISKPFDADDRLYTQFQRGLLQSSLPPDFTRVLVAYARASIAGDFETMLGTSRWLRGTDEKLRIPAQYLRKSGPGAAGGTGVDVRAIGKGNATDVMRGLLWLIREAGYSGLVLCIDEVEELAKLGSRKRQDQALQALREYVDHAGGDGGYANLCMYLAATPDMFEDEKYFPRYDALATRIQSFSKDLNWRAPVIDLDRTPLGSDEMREMARRIAAVHAAAYQAEGEEEIPPEVINRIVDNLLVSKLSMAKPRLLARVLVDELERARQSSAPYAVPSDIPGLLRHAAAALSKETA